MSRPSRRGRSLSSSSAPIAPRDNTARVTTSSSIVYLEVFPRPVGLLGDVNDDGEVGIKDVSALIDSLLGMDVKPFNKFNADVNENNNIAINDVSVLIDMLLS